MDPIPSFSPRRLRGIALLGLLALAVAGLPQAAVAVGAKATGEPAGSPVAVVPSVPTGLTIAPGLLAELIADPALGASQPKVPFEPAAAPVGPAPKATPPSPRSPRPSPGPHGRNHVWSAALGLNGSVAWFSCSRSQPPDMAVYRWGCAGANNVYLFAHAGGPFRRLHDLYVRGRLRRGMTVTYADPNGQVRRYSVAWWKVVLPTTGDFAWAAQSRPSMTLQTCVGANSRYRLVVRLYEIR